MKIKKTAVIFAVCLIIALFYLSFGCPFRFLTGISCPGCGISRALMSLLKLDFADAFHFNPVIFAMPVFAVLFFVFRKQNKKTAVTFGIMCLCLGVVYIYRMCSGVAPDVVYMHPEEGVIYKIVRSVFYVS